MNSTFIVAYRKAMRVEFKVEGADWQYLDELSFELIQDIERTINTNPESGKLRLRENLLECLNEYPHAEAIYKNRFKREQGNDPDEWYYSATDVFGTLDMAISDLLKLLISRYPDTLEKSLIFDSKQRSIRELIKQFIPVYDPLSRSLGLHRPAPATPPPASSGSTPASVYDVAALCYYLQETGFNKFTSRAKFIKGELMPKYGYTLKSITNKCSQMATLEYRRKKRGAIKKAIEIMETTEQFNFDAAIKQAKADLALMENNT